MKTASRSVILASALIIGIFAAPSVARADPITFLSQPPLSSGQVMLLERARVVHAADGPGPEDANETTMKLTTVLMGAPHPRLTVSAILDYVWRDTDIRAPTGDRIERNVSGLGDLSLVLSSGLESRAFGGRLITAPFASVKIPTGTDDESDAFGRLPQQLQLSTGAFDVGAGVLASWCHDTLEVHAAGSYTLRTEANQYDGGDKLRFELGTQECIAPWGQCNQRSSTRLYAALESRLLWQAADQGPLAPARSGGLNAFVAPGLRAQLGQHTLEAAVEVPLTQPYEQHVDFVVSGGYRFLFR